MGAELGKKLMKLRSKKKYAPIKRFATKYGNGLKPKKKKRKKQRIKVIIVKR